MLCVYQVNAEDQTAKDLAMVMFETATLRSGYMLSDSASFADRIDRMLRLSMDVSLDAKVGAFMILTQTCNNTTHSYSGADLKVFQSKDI